MPQYTVAYKSNHNVVYSCKYRVIGGPKYRWPVPVPDVAERLKQIIHNVADEYGAEVIELEVMPDPVHLPVEVDPQFGVHKPVRKIQGWPSRFLRDEFRWLRSRLPTLWTNIYFVSTVGGASLAVIKRYIEQQKGV